MFKSERESMEFKVGDRVEVLRPAVGLVDHPNHVGPGTIEEISGSDAYVKVDANEKAWWYGIADLCHAIQEIEIHPTPSITVGTQVRLTGVVVAVFSDGAAAVEFKGGGITTGMKPQEMKHAEVVVVSMRGVAKARLDDGEIREIPNAGMRTLYMHRGDGTATLTYSDGTTYKLKPLTFKEAFPPPTQPPSSESGMKTREFKEDE